MEESTRGTRPRMLDDSSVMFVARRSATAEALCLVLVHCAARTLKNESPMGQKRKVHKESSISSSTGGTVAQLVFESCLTQFK